MAVQVLQRQRDLGRVELAPQLRDALSKQGGGSVSVPIGGRLVDQQQTTSTTTARLPGGTAPLEAPPLWQLVAKVEKL